jgi:hypothetical protein
MLEELRVLAQMGAMTAPHEQARTTCAGSASCSRRSSRRSARRENRAT